MRHLLLNKSRLYLTLLRLTLLRLRLHLILILTISVTLLSDCLARRHHRGFFHFA